MRGARRAEAPSAAPRSNGGVRLPAAAVVAVAVYGGAQMLADVASLKVAVILGLSVNMGLFLYAFTFTLRDLVHKSLGRKGTRLVILVAGAMNLLMAAYLLATASVRGDRAWNDDVAFRAVFAPVWRIVIAAAAAEIVSELADTEVYHWFVTRITAKHEWARVLVSNAVSVPIDSLIFCVGAFGWSLRWRALFEIFLFNLMVKYAATLVGIPLIYAIPGRRGARRP